MKKLLSRPLTPHLTIYSGQYTSIYSIWHRITGVSLIFFIILLLIFFKLSSYDNLYLDNTFLIQNLWISNSIFLNITMFFIYHIFNGLRHIVWDLGFVLTSIKMIKSTQLLNCSIFFYILYISSKIFY